MQNLGLPKAWLKVEWFLSFNQFSPIFLIF
jgi:hypothetical protein